MKPSELRKPFPDCFNYPDDLPIIGKREEIIKTLNNHRAVIIAGATGCGKSTQLPKMCIEAGLIKKGIIGCTQPRRIAAIFLANRVSQELKTPLGQLVGFKIRFQDKTSPNTLIKYMTDGILLAEAQQDRFFRAYDVIIIDEAHERTLNIDFLLGMLQNLVAVRNDLTVVISSATIDPEKFSKAFDGAPIIEIPGKTYPIEVLYRPPENEDDEEYTYVDQAVDALEELVKKRIRGDFLIFMPTERDIRETVQRIEERTLPNMQPYPLYAKMAAWQQEKIFAPTDHHKIIVATNVAETSLTIPNVKVVIDTGLARISVYSPRTGTQGLPILRISKASAEQRKGRCGRTSPGICVRLYSEDDFENMPDFTLPEIKRSNLAEVILRMISLRLGDVSTFPFIDPPSKRAISEGFATLRELGAIYEKNGEIRLTQIGYNMARLPLDPRLSRILLESLKQGAFHEVLVIVSALSIPDPRERPFGQEAMADSVHRQFADERSDFLTLLNIWRRYQAKVQEGMSRSKLKKWCKEHFLSYRRMQEWISVHDEILEIVEEFMDILPVSQPADYEAVHKSILAGFLGRVAIHEGKGKYRGAKGREIYIFPGSYVRGTPKWIISAEIVETSRTFARTVAEIDPAWVEEVGEHVCIRTYSNARWDFKKGNVIANERVTAFGLPIVELRPVIYGRINPQEARKIFIKQGLIDGAERLDFDFIKHNQALVKEVLETEDKLRKKGIVPIDEILYRFYDERIPGYIWSLWSLKKFLRKGGRENLLKISREILLRELVTEDLDNLYPGHIEVNGEILPLKYSFSPGSDEDGVTAIVPIQLLSSLPKEPFDWLVPGYLDDKIQFLLKQLPKPIRRKLIPINETVKNVISKLEFGRGNFFEALSKAVEAVTGLWVDPETWTTNSVPDYLRFRFEVISPDGKVVASGRNIEELKKSAPDSYEDDLWKKAKLKYEIEDLQNFPTEDLEEKVFIGKDANKRERYGYRAFVPENKGVSIRIFPSLQEARETNRHGTLALVFKLLGEKIKKVGKHWTIPPELLPASFFIGSASKVHEKIINFIIRDVFQLHHPIPFELKSLRKKFDYVRKNFYVLGQERYEAIFNILATREKIRMKIDRYMKKCGFKHHPAMERMQAMMVELNELVPRDFLDIYSFEDLRRCEHYLKGLELRIDRAYSSPEKDRLKEEKLREMVQKLRKEHKFKDDKKTTELLWLIQDCKMAVFAPEIKPLRKLKTF
ncbi:MAG: ATP-dependent RNA helicase HrpA [Deltaproteobacteria bacterium]|nr:ATP-dependent RNA helicase HrpA [Deltaproteobacteria bacterium]